MAADMPKLPDLGDGWIEWQGGKCPVEPATRVDLEYRDGDIVKNVPAHFATNCWPHDDHPFDIIAYRVVSK